MPKPSKPPQDFETSDRPPITLLPVESNKLKAVGYDSATHTLAVQFKFSSGAVYHYPDVSPEVHQAFMGAESMGRYFGQELSDLPFKKYRADEALIA